MAHWRSASFSWCLTIRPLTLSADRLNWSRANWTCSERRGGLPAARLGVGGEELGARGPLGGGADASPNAPQGGAGLRVGVLDALGLGGLADRFEELLAVVLDQRLEEGHAEHLALALVDARGQEVVQVVAEQVALEEGPAAVGLHEQVDGGFLHRLAAEDLGEDALHLSAVGL